MEKRPIKKYIIRTAAIVGVLAAIALGYYLYMYRVPHIPYTKSKVTDNIDECNIMAQACVDFYNSIDDDEEIWSVMLDLDRNKLIHLKYHDTNDEYDMTSEQIDAFKALIHEHIFYVDHINCIEIVTNNDFVVFSNPKGQACFIYSVSGERPDFCNTPASKNKKICVQKITDNWYYSCKQ
ncbi:MAG: hypothetical protein K6F91_06130 [Ruminococcus sp.]|nr:hypothetical protein [Ruminococcus sp.]